MENAHLSFHLSDDFVAKYANRPVEWGYEIGAGNSLGELTFITKYSRLKADGSKERWHETCRRVIEGMFSIQKDHCTDNRTPWYGNKAQRAAEDAYERLFTFKWTPPGRGLWMMGTEFTVKNGSAALQNCFRGSEEFITREYGPVSFEEVVGETVQVLTRLGWKKAEVNCFGEQTVQRLTFAPAHPTSRGSGFRIARSNHRVEVTATPEHRWLLADGSETTDLRSGDTVLSHGGYPWVDGSREYSDGLVHGLIFGDGTRSTFTYKSGLKQFHIRLCGDKAQAHVDRFETVSYPASYGGDPWAVVNSEDDLKDFPTSEKSSNYYHGFLDGWIAADASETDASMLLCSQNVQAEEWLKRYACYSGWVLRGVNTDSVMVTNFGERKNPMRRFTLSRGDWLAWKVVDIEVLPDLEPVYCATVPEVGAFTLASGVYTGNCAFLSTEHLGVRNATTPFVRLMEMSMLGIGVGFDTRGAGKLTIHEPSNQTPLLPAGEPYVIPDSREGWCDSTKLVLESYLLPNHPAIELDYSEIRPAGAPIKGFGGTAAGPGPLKKLHEGLKTLFDGRAGTALTSTDIVDIQNMIGKCVVAGNVRRSAEIAFGFPEDKEFLELKDWEKNPVRMGQDGWGNLSNNSVIAEVGGNYDHLAEQISKNGEPGLLYLDLARSHGRLVDAENNKDRRALGANPCAEQTLEDNECCTLVETYPIKHDSLEDYLKTIKVAYLYAKSVTLVPTHWPETNLVMTRNRRIGTSMSGIVQFAEKYGQPELRKWCDEAFQAVHNWDVEYSEWLGVRESIKTTSVKPSGTVSLLAGVTPGVHWPVASDTYIRRQRFRVNDDALNIIVAAGYHAEPDVMDPEHTMVVEFPTAGPNVRNEKQVSVWEKAALAVLLQAWWADNQVSATFTFQPHEQDQIAPILRAFDGQLKSASFLPLMDGGAYRQMPYESIDRAQFDAMRKPVRPIDWNVLYDSGVDAQGERFCSNDSCEI